MSSPYQILENRPIDQWKVTELKEELKRRKLPVRGLKEDLVKRLDEAVRIERESAQSEDENGLESSPSPVVEESIETQETVVSEDFRGIADNDGKKLEKEDNLPVPVDTNNGVALSDQENIQEGYVFVGKKEDISAEEETLVQETVVHASAKVTESVVPEVPIREQDLPKTEVQEESGNSERLSKTQLEIDNTKPQLENEYAKPTSEEVALDASAPENQVSEVSHNLGSPVKYDSISTDSVSINEKIEIKDNIIADNVKLELDNIKPEMVAPSSSPIVPVGGDSHPHAMDVEEPHENNTSIEEKDDINDNNNADMSKKFDSVDVGYSEKLNLDRSSGDDSMEEDVLESRQVESKYRSDVLGDGGEKIEISDVNEGGHVDIVGDDISADKEDGNDKDRPFTAAEKRKLDAESLVGNNEPVKRQRRWNTESLKVPEPQSSNLTPTPKDTLQSPATKRFSRADSITDEDALKERVVPPSPKPPTNSLRVDRFLRPFTLKAVQELLGKTGKVTSFWMDHIKTHCYVTYSSVEEAVETRNAVYNLQWPPNGGRQLLAEFVDPQEVKTRLETPQTPAVSASAVPAVALTPPGPRAQESPRQPRQQQQKVPEAPASLPPPPPLSSPLQARERLTLPPPPPLPEKLEPPIMTLDDLFRKTKVTPRVYYLPLSEEQVAMKLAAQGRSAK